MICFGTVCVGTNRVVFLGIKVLSIKSLFLMQPEVCCSDSGTHSGPVCEVLLLHTNAT